MEDELDRTDPGIPEPQIGPSQFNPRMSGVHSGGGGDQIILESIEELSQDSLNETQVKRFLEENFNIYSFLKIRKQLKKR